MHFSLLKVCCRKQKHLEKWISFKYSLYSVFLRGINRHPMWLTIIFLHSPDTVDYIKWKNLHFLHLNFCSRKQNTGKWITCKCSMCSVLLRGINMDPMCIKFTFLNSPGIGNYKNLMNLPFLPLKFCCIKQKYTDKGFACKYSMDSVILTVINRRRMCKKCMFLKSPNIESY